MSFRVARIRAIPRLHGWPLPSPGAASGARWGLPAGDAIVAAAERGRGGGASGDFWARDWTYNRAHMRSQKGHLETRSNGSLGTEKITEN